MGLQLHSPEAFWGSSKGRGPRVKHRAPTMSGAIFLPRMLTFNQLSHLLIPRRYRLGWKAGWEGLQRCINVTLQVFLLLNRCLFDAGYLTCVLGRSIYTKRVNRAVGEHDVFPVDSKMLKKKMGKVKPRKLLEWGLWWTGWPLLTRWPKTKECGFLSFYDKDFRKWESV